MSRLFDNASNEYLTNTSFVGVTAAPLTLACWVNTDEDNTNFQTALSIGDSSSGVDYFALEIMMLSGDTLRATTRSSVGRVQAEEAGILLNTWQHVAGVFASSTSRYAYVDGSKSSENTSDRTPAGIDTVRIASVGSASPESNDFSGMIAEAAIWDVALTDDEILMLAKGYSPLLVRPQNLVFYVPLVRDNDNDLILGLSMTASGSPGVSEHPPILRPSMPHVPHIVTGGVVYDMSASGEFGFEGTAGISSLKSISADGQIGFEGSADVTNLISISGAGEFAHEGAADIVAIIGLSASGEIAVRGSASLAGTFGLSASGEFGVQGQAVLNAIKILKAVGEYGYQGTANLTFVVAQDGTLSRIFGSVDQYKITGAVDLLSIGGEVDY